MEELSLVSKEFKDGSEEVVMLRLRGNSHESDETLRDSLSPSANNLKGTSDSSSDDDAPRKRIMKRVKRFSDSDSDSGRDKTLNEDISGSDEKSPGKNSVLQSDDSDNDINVNKSVHKSRIQTNLSDSDESGSDNAVKNDEQQLRMMNKRNKLRDKFKTLITARGKDPSPTNIEDEVNRRSSNSSSDDGEDIDSIEKIKQKIKERMSFKPSICDPDTSDEETNQWKPVHKQKKERKMTRPTSPKPQRMSAKQAMENMQKIKSESNRMLREKEVSLPYHRPKALSLKDIMSRRRTALSSDGKALPIKMNEDQLKQYAQMLEERQKEMMELCKSESDDEENDEQSADKDTALMENKKTEDDIINTAENENTEVTPEKDSTERTEIVLTDTMVPTTTNTDQTDIIIHNVPEEDCLDNAELVTNNESEITKEQDSENSMLLVYNDSANSMVDDTTLDKEATSSNIETENNGTISDTEKDGMILSEKINDADNKNESCKVNKEESQLISLHYVAENTEDLATDITVAPNENTETSETLEHNSSNQSGDNVAQNESMEVDNEFSDDEINMADIDDIIENAEIIKDIEDKVNSQFLVRDKPLNLNPKLAGAPGMVINLEGSEAPRKSGIELLKERFTYFAKLKTPEEMEREREKKTKPGLQLKKLKQELEEKIAEQRSIEWAKRLEDEKQQQKELKELRGEESEEDDIDKIEAAIEGKDEVEDLDESESEGEEEPIENDIVIKDKPRLKNAMVDDEAEESDCEDEDQADNEAAELNENEDGINGENEDNDNEGEESESDSDDSDESSESDEEQAVTKKGRILKAFEDSDDEEVKIGETVDLREVQGTAEAKSGSSLGTLVQSQILSQDEELQLAQRHKSCSEDLFTSQESALLASEAKEKSKEENEETLTQTFSIVDTSKHTEVDLNSPVSESVGDTQAIGVSNLEFLCPITETQKNLPLPSQIAMTQGSQSQPIGEDILALCTGQFYDNQFVSQIENQNDVMPLGESQKYDAFDNFQSQDSQEEQSETHSIVEKERDNTAEILDAQDDFIELNVDGNNAKSKVVDDNLNSILDELADPEFDSPKPNKFFTGSKNTQKDVHESQAKKRFVIDSDEESNETESDIKKRKKLKKKKPEKRALQISDDEEELSEQEEVEEYESEIEEDNPDRLVEYDSEENEIQIKPQNQKPKKKRKMTEFFENEAELTSEDEWAGSGDEDEAGLDRMEREEGDDDTFHQGALQQELGLIHMRDVLDQDKREVRLIQELLFEDGDLGGGGRQRKFRWKDLDGGDEVGTVPDEFADTQEEEFESEEQWRKQRHERETFLRQMHDKEKPEENANVTVNRTTIIKANLLSKTMSNLLMEVNTTEDSENPPVEKKNARDIPSPKKPFALLQQTYQGSLLSRGRGALARLAALATPLAADDDAKVGTIGPNSRRNFVFASITPEEKQPKVTKRKAESNPNTPKLVKKMRTEDKQNTSRNSLLDHFKV